MSLLVKIKKLHEDAIVPNQPYDGDAGFDLYTVEDVTFNPGEYMAIPTGLSIVVPKGYAELIWDKSGISTKHAFKTLGGVIDSGYRGEVCVGMINLSDKEHTFKKGEKIAQMLIQKIEEIVIEEVEELDKTDRNTNGFGSSGV